MTNKLRFNCTVGKSLATGMIVHKFKVMKGSVVQDVKDFLKDHQSTYYKKRNRLEKEGVIKDGRFTTDYEFDSPSEASCVILGTSTANFTNWKLSSNQSLHNFWDNPRRVRGKSKKTR